SSGAFSRVLFPGIGWWLRGQMNLTPIPDHDLQHVGQAAVLAVGGLPKVGLDVGREADREGLGLL
ncbi:MAG: hypothetical protein WAM94_17545, partial [Chromatiaceae bacterium]